MPLNGFVIFVVFCCHHFCRRRCRSPTCGSQVPKLEGLDWSSDEAYVASILAMYRLREEECKQQPPGMASAAVKDEKPKTPPPRRNRRIPRAISNFDDWYKTASEEARDFETKAEEPDGTDPTDLGFAATVMALPDGSPTAAGPQLDSEQQEAQRLAIRQRMQTIDMVECASRRKKMRAVMRQMVMRSITGVGCVAGEGGRRGRGLGGNGVWVWQARRPTDLLVSIGAFSLPQVFCRRVSVCRLWLNPKAGRTC